MSFACEMWHAPVTGIPGSPQNIKNTMYKYDETESVVDY